MVTVTRVERTAADFDRWIETEGSRWSEQGRELVIRAFHTAFAGADSEHAEPVVRALAIAHVVADLGLSPDLVAVPLIIAGLESGNINSGALESGFGSRTAKLVADVARINSIGNLLPAEHERPSGAQSESFRKLLLSVAEDGRVVLIALAERLQQLRTPSAATADRRQTLARETLDIFAPLANRLGIGQLKWELEDLAFRELEPERYHRLAKQLEESRLNRERYVERVEMLLRGHLSRARIDAQVCGRVKHIYSIWRKMQRKGLPFEEIFDVRALRVLVDSVPDCYSALGVVHALWKPVQEEFDDYVANPKGNGYQSLHTAVIGPRGRTIEVQIRTRAMHENAELGVAAHWRYKEGATGREDSFEHKIAWLRQLLEVRDEEDTDLLDRFHTEAFEDRVYAITPRGEILDLPQGATPLDFAYKLHSEVGHRCRGAKVNGRIVPLSYQIKSGERIEVLTTRHGGPSRDWLNANLGYLRTARARSKVRHWFRQIDQINNTSAGRSAIEQEFARLGLRHVDLDKVAQRLKFAHMDEMLAAVGFGDVTVLQVANVAREQVASTSDRHEFLPAGRRASPRVESGEIQVRGVGSLLTQMSQCCKPVPPEPIVGYITQGRGVSIHREDCRNLLNLRTKNAERIVEVDWGHEAQVYPVDVVLEAFDRTGLLRDVATVLAAEKVNVLSMNSQSDSRSSTARMDVTLEIGELGQLQRVLDKLANLPNVVQVARRQ